MSQTSLPTSLSKELDQNCVKLGHELSELTGSLMDKGLTPESLLEWIEKTKQALNQVGLESFVATLASMEEELGTFPHSGTKYRFKGVEKKSWLTAFGLAEIDRRVYGACSGGVGIAMLDVKCGMTGRYMTPDLVDLVCHASAMVTPAEARELLRKTLPVAPSATAIKNEIRRVGEFIEQHEKEIELSIAESKPMSKDADILAISWDGVMVPMRRPESVEWKEAGVARVSVYREGSEAPDLIDSRYIARMPEKGMATLLDQLARQVASLRAERDFRDVLVLCDGKKAIWTAAEKMKALDGAIFVLDFYHAAQHLKKAADAVFGEGTAESNRWFERRRESMMIDYDGLDKIIRSLKRSLGKLRAQKKRHESVSKTINYFRNNRARMGYPSLVARGLPIGSGPVESACKSLVQSRLKRSGMRWTLEGGQHVLNLRTVLKSNRWEPMWASVVAGLAA